MSELQLISNVTATSEKIEFPSFDLPQNYSILINKLEQLALGLDSALGNFTVEHKDAEIVVNGASDDFIIGLPTTAGRVPPPRIGHTHMDEVEYSRVVSDIWIGVILTLLIVCVIFFICSCFLYHKFQQWKNSYRTNPNEPVEICRHYGPDFEVESLPSYTIVSGLPTYDAALEEFRKAGIILTPQIPIIKIFENDAKEGQIFNVDNVDNAGDNISINSTCTCGGANNSSNILSANNLAASLLNVPQGSGQVIELSPEHLATLSQKRLSLQIGFSNAPTPVRRNSRPRVDLYREVSRNNMLRSRAVGNTAMEAFPQIHRSSSSSSLTNDRNHCEHRRHHMQHRGSLC
ncbi:protein commissureless 2 homolog [Teleopsis dalmanni]|uniref:protein commissureless 2 homolog n=1 Tax=Teleopsis dalmanni TaxID=139649 RepID=UPI0018CE0139|nr:protein commissureless 2 homolog [Teleopsis dalmanni]